ncbi:hypothetical protein [Herbiconiux ginsengi]|uniref:Uncharacterized protein n=1 Tax=Herbiconiux ginsengi TaxID=381665 RepID=A0A1H3RFB5_9MICO|nr:hypothetical protein [Herbiconiux ginsengi]SDZ23951.1 hypothetical protein SAMN05216554_2767 [Herbiconiux ginsengi]
MSALGAAPSAGGVGGGDNGMIGTNGGSVGMRTDGRPDVDDDLVRDLVAEGFRDRSE